jgi:hypothetical protein
MWVLYRQVSTKRSKKFLFAKGTNLPEKIEDKSGIWHLADPLFLSLKVQPPEKGKLLGYAILTKDDITGFNHWSTYNMEGGDLTNLSPEQPIVVPTTMQLGMRVELYAPEE